MIQKHTETYALNQTGQSRRIDRSLQLVLWTLWTLAVSGTALYRWYVDISSGRTLDIVGLVVYSVLAGLVGLLVITILELRLDPEQFFD
jgi:hypothetical protein